MTTKNVQLSAVVSEETRAMLDAASEAGGLKKGHLIEEAVLHYLHALRELPVDVIIPPRLVLDDAASHLVADRLAAPTEPTWAMRELMAGEAGDDVPWMTSRFGA